MTREFLKSLGIEDKAPEPKKPADNQEKHEKPKKADDAEWQLMPIMGMPYPAFLKKALQALRDKGDNGNKDG